MRPTHAQLADALAESLTRLRPPAIAHDVTEVALLVAELECEKGTNMASEPCPFCGRHNKFGGTVIWCECIGWIDQALADNDHQEDLREDRAIERKVYRD